jgi:hypothetical protein
VALAALFPPAGAAGQRVAPVRRDSAGIDIVTYARDAAPRRFSLRPAGVEIGTGSGSELHRVVSAIRMPNGRTIVADAGRREILRFGPTGALERALARVGAGPGEFTDLRSMHRHGRDSIVAHDGGQMRFAVFSDSGFARQVLLQKSEHLFQIETSLLGLLPDGRAIVTSGASIALGDPGPARVERAEFPLVSYAADGRPGRLLGRYPGFELEVSVIRQGPRTGGFSRGLRLFGATSAFGLAGENIIVVDNASFQFDVVDTSGRLIRRVRRQHVPEAVRPSHMAAYANDRVSAISDPARKASRQSEYESASHALVFPALDARLVIDAVQRIWLGSFLRPGDKEQEWWLFGIDGTLVGRVTVPSALTVTDAGTDYVLGIWRDADGVQTIRQYRLVPSN